MTRLPGGAVTFLFTDIEGSTRLVKALRERYQQVLAEHRRLVRAAVAAQDGHEVDTQGDAFFVAFVSAKQAVLCALAIQRALASHAWPADARVRVRIGIHTGHAVPAGGGYTGLAVHRAARICAAACGGQVLVSQATESIIEDEEEDLGFTLVDLGEQKLKDLDRPVRVFQLAAPDLDAPAALAVAPRVEGHRADAGAPVAPPARRPWPRAIAGSGGLGGGRRRARLLVIGSAVAVAAAAVGLVVARPWAGAPVGVPGNTVGLIGAAGGRLGAPVSVGSPDGLAYGDRSLWAVDSTDGTLVRINPATHAVVQTIPVGSAPVAVTVTGGDVWVVNSGDGTVSWVNAAANIVVKPIRVGNLPVAIASGRSGVWVANEGDGTVTRIDPVTGQTSGPFPVGGRPDGIAVGRSGVWVANEGDGTVTRIDPVIGQTSGPFPVGAGPAGIAVTPAAVWVANSLDLTVSKLDPATGRMTDTIPVGDGPGAVAAARNGIWVSDEFNATLDRIDPRTDQVARTIHLGSSPRGLAAAGPGVWVAARAFAAASHRGGTLTVGNDRLPVRDPALAYNIWSQPALATVYDGLVALRRSGGPAGLTLVPDLAIRLPRPADGGRTYAFTLRRGIRYSTGTLVRASDIRRGIGRQLSFGGYPGYYEDILGGQACHRRPARCDLSAGIVTDDAAGTVTFHLSQADPDFLYKLALLLAVPAPRGAPSHPINRAPFLPGTGPYMISQYRPGASFILVRNPYFRQWSYAAQPAGYPDVIRYERVTSPDEQKSVVIAGEADLVVLDGGIQSLASRYPTRVHPGLKLDTSYGFLNTRQPPFTNIKARQAVNYAINRAQIIRLYHFAPGQAAPTCQILPADFPGHHSYCPYTAGPKNGAWHRPDLNKAVQLAKQSGTTHVPVTVWSLNFTPEKAVGSYLVRLLKKLGYRANLHAVSVGQLFTQAGNPRSKIQMGFGPGWGADFPAPSSFFQPLLSCRSLHESPTYTSNWAEFCDPHADKVASRAQAAQVTDPAYARRLWAQADRVVTDQAPLLPVYNETSAAFVSSRVGNYQTSPVYGPLLDQMWVR